MEILLDSHVFLWYVQDSFMLKKSAADTVRSASKVFVSAASIWELSIKMAKGKLPEDFPLLEFAIQHDFHLLPVTPDHAAGILTLPRNHRDPFDHLLLSQAKVENLTLMTHDTILARYGVPVLLV